MKDKQLTLCSLFDGSGGFCLAGLMAGIRPVSTSEIEPFPIRVTTKRLPFVKHLGDVTKIHGAEIDPVDIITFGSPCFPEGTLVLTDEGYLPIEDVCVGMKVLTHLGRWRKVTAAGSKYGTTVILKGNHYGLECTPNHPIYSTSEKKYYLRQANGKRGCATTILDEKNWIPAENMQGKLWAVPNRVDMLPISSPDYSYSGRYKKMPEISEDLFYFVGRWLGDGWVYDNQRPGRPAGQTWGKVFLCDSLDKEPEIINTVSKITENYCVSHDGAIVKVNFTSHILCDWLTDNFGKYAAGKTMPAWVFGMEPQYREALLHGLFDSDGYKVSNTESWRISTVSKRLAESIRLLGEIQGYSVTLYKTKTKNTTTIENRTVTQCDYYTAALTKGVKRKHFKDSNHGWYRVRSVTPTDRTVPVYNLTVEEDNSYVADGIVVHNCQDMSLAGKRAGLNGSRSNLFYEAIRIVKEMREATNGDKPRYIVWENVPGAFSSNKGEDFKAVLDAVRRVKDGEADTPRPAKWQNAGCILADDYSVAWRVLDAQYFGVPQRRRRIYLVADLDGQCAGKILFESEGLSGYFTKGGTERKTTSGDAEEGAGAAGRICLNDQGGNRMDVTEDVTCTLRAEAHHPPVVTEAAGFCTEHSAKSRSIGYEEETSPTLRASVVPAAVALENHPTDSRVKISEDGTVQTLTSRMGTGGNNVPLVAEEQKTYDVRFTSENTKNKRHNVYETDTSRTLDTGGNHPDSNQGGVAVVCVDQGGGKSNCSVSAGVAPTLACTHGGEPVVAFSDIHASLSANDGSKGPSSQMLALPEENFVCETIAIEGNGARPSHQGKGYSEDDVSFTLNATEQHGVAYGIDRAAFNQGTNAQYGIAVEEEIEPTIVAKGPGAVSHPVYASSKASFFTRVSEDKAETLVASDYKDPPTVSENPYYIVRILTPTECARLQGFPDWWCAGLETENPTNEDLSFWRKVFDTYAKATGSKPKTEAQILKWLKNPHSDSKEYSMWGNGICVNCGAFVLAGIVYYDRLSQPEM